MIERFYPSWEQTPFSIGVRFIGKSDFGARELNSNEDSPPIRRILPEGQTRRFFRALRFMIREDH